MSYDKKTWVSKEVITKEALNNIENGIFNLNEIIENLVKSISLGIHTDGAVYIFIDGHPVGTGIIASGDYFGSTDGYVDVNNNVITSNKLDIGIYTLKYENEDGTYITIGNFNISEEEVNKNKKVDINFIPQNIAPVGAKNIVIFDSNDNKVNSIPLGNLAPKNLGTKLYSFGALSDVHLPYAAQNASTDFQKALTYFNNVANVNFICIAGDISDAGTEAEWLDYKNHVDTYSPNTPVYMCTGNHDTAGDITYEYPIQYTGHPLWYSFTQGDDVFIFFGLRMWQGNNVFYDEALQWLYETLEENKDKRCFVFQHEMRLDGCGNGHGLYGWDGLAGKNGQVFLSLMEHYKNVIWFHGHSHTPFRLQSVQPTPIANYDRLHGCHSVHIPSLAIPRYGNSDVIFDAEGYVVDVYDNGIHLRGIDFIEEEFVPIATYWIDTTPVDIPVESYSDATGTIKKKAITLPKDSELTLNQRYSYSGKGLVADTGMFVTLIPVNNMTGSCTVKIKNSSIPINTAASSVIYALDSNKISLAHINGGNIPNMTTGITYSEDYKSADITFTLPNGCAYIALSLRVNNGINITAADIKEYIIEIEGEEVELPENENSLPEGTEVKVNTQFSETDGGFKELSGYRTYVIPVEPDTSYKFNIANIPSGNLNTPTATIYELTAEQVFNSRINGSKYIYSMTDTVISEDCTSAEVNFITTSNARYIVVTISAGGVNPDDIRISLETQLPKGTEVKANTQFSESDGGFREMSGYTAYVIPVEPETSYKFNIANIPADNLTKDSATIYELTADQVFNSRINGSKYIHSMTDTTISEDGTSAKVNFDTSSNARYIVVSIIPGSVDPNNVRITLKVLGVVLPQGDITDTVTWTMDKRLSSTGDPDKDNEGAMVSDYILVNHDDVINIYGISSLGARSLYINFYKDEIFVFNIPLSNPDVNPEDNGYAYAEYKSLTKRLTIQIKDMPVNSIRVCCVASTVEVYRNAEAEGFERLDPIVLPEGSELQLNTRYSYSSAKFVGENGMIAVTIPVNKYTGKPIVIRIKNSAIPLNALVEGGNNSHLHLLQQDKTNLIHLFGVPIPSISSEYITYSTDYKSADIYTTIPSNCGYLVISLRVMQSQTTIYDSNLKDYIIEIEEVGNEDENEISVPEGSELLIGQRYSHSSGGYVADDTGVRMFVLTIPVESHTDYLLTCKNLKIPFTVSGSTLYQLNADKSYVGTVNGNSNFHLMTSGVTILDEGKGAEVEFVTSPTTKYIVVSILVSDVVISAEDIKDYIITLEKIEVEIETSEPKDITNNVTWTADTRLSSNDGTYKTESGIYASNDIPVKKGDIIRIYGCTLWRRFSYICAYNNESVLIGFLNLNENASINYFIANKVNNNLTIEIMNKNVSYIRVCGDGIVPVNVSVSINKELISYDFNGVYDEPYWFDAYIDSNTGQISTEDSGFATTAFLRYNKQNNYIFNVTEAMVPYRVFFYDSNKAFISCTDQLYNLTCIINNAPIGTAYFRFRGDYDNTNGTFTFNTAASNVTYNIIQRPTYDATNLVPTSQSVDSTAVYNEFGYKENVYISTTNNAEGTMAGYTLTGLIPYTITKESAPTIYVRGVELPDDDTYVRFTLYNSEKTVVGIMYTTDLRETYFTKETLGDRYYKFTPVRAASTGDIRLSNNLATGDAYIRIGGKGFGEGLIVSFDEPIEQVFNDLLDIYDIKLNYRWSASLNDFEGRNGTLAFSVPFSDIDGKTIKLVGFEPETTTGISTWYACKDGAAIGRIANPGTGVIWTSSELVNNGDGTYDITISKELFKDINRTDTPISVIPDTIYITMYVQERMIEQLVDELGILINE